MKTRNHHHSLRWLADRLEIQIGAACSPALIEKDKRYRETLSREFNCIVAENCMKFMYVHPGRRQYDFTEADKLVEFARVHQMRLRGHTLVWHHQLPAWLAQGKFTRTEALDILQEHVFTVMGHFRGQSRAVYCWDVVNEAIDDKDSVFFRASDWYKICGEEFIADAFRWAHEADPKALLFYNDYDTESPGKRDKIFNVLRKLKADRVPIDGIGLQGHWDLTTPTEKTLRESIAKFSSLGLQVQVTELDVSVYSPAEKDPSNHQFTAEREQRQMGQYKMIFRVLREYKRQITGVTFWNVSDRSSWLDNFPVRGRKNYPLLFDQQLHPKKAFWEVVKF